MVSKQLILIMGGCFGGAFVVMAAMSLAGGGAPPGSYTGISDASHKVTDPAHCNSFQTGCKNNIDAPPPSDLTSGAYLSGNYQQP
ncbi:MAG: hypothetical protein ACREA1_02925 [Nitrosotalea sp.]